MHSTQKCKDICLHEHTHTRTHTMLPTPNFSLSLFTLTTDGRAPISSAKWSLFLGGLASPKPTAWLSLLCKYPVCSLGWERVGCNRVIFIPSRLPRPISAVVSLSLAICLSLPCVTSVTKVENKPTPTSSRAVRGSFWCHGLDSGGYKPSG